jgi:hypothetical protein
MADECHDLSNKEQMSIVLRYLDPKFVIQEKFVGFVHLKDGMTGEAIANAILSFLARFGLDIMNCRGQGYDGAGAIAGKVNGCASRILRINSKAIFTHCFCHRLNLAVCSSCSIPVIRDLFNFVKEISYFFNFSEKRQQMLDKAITDLDLDTQKTKLLDICKTRWLQRIEGLDRFYDLFIPLFNCFERMSLNVDGNCNDKTRTGGAHFYNLMGNFRFIVSLIVTKNLLDRCEPATRALQSSSMDILAAVETISSLSSVAQDLRDNVDEIHTSGINRLLIWLVNVMSMNGSPELALLKKTVITSLQVAHLIITNEV